MRSILSHSPYHLVVNVRRRWCCLSLRLPRMSFDLLTIGIIMPLSTITVETRRFPGTCLEKCARSKKINAVL